MTLPGPSRPDVMERAGLITKERRGWERIVQSDFAAVGRVRRALDEPEATWRERVKRMEALLAEEPDARR